jgi:hypothetical protein
MGKEKGAKKKGEIERRGAGAAGAAEKARRM